MKALHTRYLPATNTKPARIKAHDQDGNQITTSLDNQIDSNEHQHDRAVWKLCQKMQWTRHHLMRGGTKAGYVYVFDDHGNRSRRDQMSHLNLPENKQHGES